MGDHNLDPADRELVNAAITYVRDTPRLAKYRKTIINVAGIIANVALLIATVPSDLLPPEVAGIVVVGIQGVASALAYAFPNAITEEQADKLAGYVTAARR